ncbi:hypothetical protein [Kitasatospora sp. NPDC015120]|uniref:hypothetical protein n=1 Tax=Kitasatospora sp. NPDC015120 TaxID=3364023 RepID=UPI0036F4561E
MAAQPREPARPDYYPKLGEQVRDRLNSRNGVYMGTVGGQVYLRRADGGVEWTTCHSEIEPAIAVDELNTRTRGRGPQSVSSVA